MELAAVEPEGSRLHWIKATASMGNEACVEFATAAGDMIALRDSKNPHAASLMFTRAEVAAFLDGAKKCEFDHLVEP